MKQMKWVVLVMVVALFAVAVPAMAEEEGLGEWVSDAAPKGESKLIPPGQYAAIAKFAEEFLTPVPGDANKPGGHRALYAYALTDGIDKDELADELNDFYIVDVRTPAEFCAGTVNADTINIPMNELFQAQNLQKLPLDKPILLVCNSGHTASVVNAILGTMGYNAWTLRFGMIGWKTDSKVAFAVSTVKVPVSNVTTKTVDGKVVIDKDYGHPAYIPVCPK
jgi:rhodanese-related sulfurtransferase